MRGFLTLTLVAFLMLAPALLGQGKNFEPVTQEMLLNPSPDDWLMFSRTYDAQRFTPLRQINRQNVTQLRMAWALGIESGFMEQIPLVYRGVMYFVTPAGSVQAVDATNGDPVWEYKRKFPEDMKTFVGGIVRTKSLAIYQDLIFYATHDGYVVALDARSGELRWETQTHDYKTTVLQTSAPIVADGKVLTGRSCSPTSTRVGCFIQALDALTGKEVWKFYTTAAPGDPGGDTWGSVPVEKRVASPWGLPGSYDPVRKLIYWGIANPLPYTRLKRHGGNPEDIPQSSPADAYSNSTVAIHAETGKLAWYFQNLPGDDWDLDHVQERILLRTRFNPDPAAVKWINPQIPRGQERDVEVTVSEGGGVWVNDRATGQFLWATPFPLDVPEFHISKIDVETGKTYISWDRVLKKDGDKKIVCFLNTKGFWPMAYDPGRNSIFVPYTDQCIEITADSSRPNGFSSRNTILRPGADPNALAGMAKVNLETGRIQRIHTSKLPSTGAVLATAGDLVFWGDRGRRFRAFDSDSGKILWETILGAPITMSTISYAVNGKQYIAVTTGEAWVGQTGRDLSKSFSTPQPLNTLYVFALPDAK